MNAIAPASTNNSLSASLEMSPDELVSVLQNSLYPGAKPESIKMVLAWCRATGRDPMKKPVHIVPHSVKVADGRWEMRDTLMPGIGTYRTDAARTGEYAGKTEPEFGPDKTVSLSNVSVTFPTWCKVTVFRMIGGQARPFPHIEYWMENYATAGRNTQAPNAMWLKRPYGQLAKCTEAQALRQAFPEETGNTNTMEEMEGKTFIEGVAEPAPTPLPRQEQKAQDRTAPRAPADDEVPSLDEPKQEPAKPQRSVRESLRVALLEARSLDDIASAERAAAVAKILRDGPDEQRRVLQGMIAEARARFAPQIDGEAAEDGPAGDEPPPPSDDAPPAEDAPSAGTTRDRDELIRDIRNLQRAGNLAVFEQFLAKPENRLKMRTLSDEDHGEVSDLVAQVRFEMSERAKAR